MTLLLCSWQKNRRRFSASDGTRLFRVSSSPPATTSPPDILYRFSSAVASSSRKFYGRLVPLCVSARLYRRYCFTPIAPTVRNIIAWADEIRTVGTFNRGRRLYFDRKQKKTKKNQKKQKNPCRRRVRQNSTPFIGENNNYYYFTRPP